MIKAVVKIVYLVPKDLTVILDLFIVQTLLSMYLHICHHISCAFIPSSYTVPTACLGEGHT